MENQWYFHIQWSGNGSLDLCNGGGTVYIKNGLAFSNRGLYVNAPRWRPQECIVDRGTKWSV